MTTDSFKLWRVRHPFGVKALALVAALACFGAALACFGAAATAKATERTDTAQPSTDRPAGRDSQSRGGPPAQALAACQNASAGQKCTFTDRGQSLAGSCWAPADKPLACRPSNAPGPRASEPAAPAR